MSANEPQTYFEQRSEPTSVLIEDYRGPGGEQAKPYPAERHIIPATTISVRPEAEPQWMADNRNPEKMTNFRRWLLRRNGEDDPVVYAAARSLGWAALSFVLATAALLILLLHQNELPPASDSTPYHIYIPYQAINLNIVAIALSFTMLAALLITLPSSLVDILRVRRVRDRASRPVRANRLTRIALTVAALVIVAAIVSMLMVVGYYSQGGV